LGRGFGEAAWKWPKKKRTTRSLAGRRVQVGGCANPRHKGRASANPSRKRARWCGVHRIASKWVGGWVGGRVNEAGWTRTDIRGAFVMNAHLTKLTLRQWHGGVGCSVCADASLPLGRSVHNTPPCSPRGRVVVSQRERAAWPGIRGS
jgi:hypothetical protein